MDTMVRSCVCFTRIKLCIATKLNYNRNAIPDTIFIISALLMAVGSLKFIASQVPYYMKGVLQILGVGCQSLAISGTINDMSILVGPFQRKLSTWGTKLISCLFWYALNYAHYIMHNSYCKYYRCTGNKVVQKERDVLPNKHFFAENYYSKLLEQHS